MLKMYHRHVESGASSAYWEEFGSEGTLADRLRFCDVDPLRPLFLRYLTPGATMLEGGCGRGQYVAYYTARGAKVVGLDFARDWLTAIHRETPSLRLCAGDVGALPFRDGTFDLYYSGGVVEHFEGGADRALAEARRVLKLNGTLLISVPYHSPMRRTLAMARHAEWRRVSAPALDASRGNGLRFYQYAYTVREFSRMLAAAGLRVVDTQGYAIAWGLYDVDALRRLAGRRQRGRGASPARTAAIVSSAPPANGSRPASSLLKRLVVAEDASVPGAGLLVRVARWACANMMMYVCTPDARAAA
jgi:ubiquinone/menaquinone biosynthesis C-methylase UbiE